MYILRRLFRQSILWILFFTVKWFLHDFRKLETHVLREKGRR